MPAGPYILCPENTRKIASQPLHIDRQMRDRLGRIEQHVCTLLVGDGGQFRHGVTVPRTFETCRAPPGRCAKLMHERADARSRRPSSPISMKRSLAHVS